MRKDNLLIQEKFGKLFHVTRQTVSNWENGKCYPDLQILVSMSNQFSSHPVLFKTK
ncbi:MAG: helix-turn-helix transcriptional regulator [Clostridiales bacterium]|nr:helix-turn-helix transcriptional regulator [Clostridiales bacterium]